MNFIRNQNTADAVSRDIAEIGSTANPASAKKFVKV